MCARAGVDLRRSIRLNHRPDGSGAQCACITRSIFGCGDCGQDRSHRRPRRRLFPSEAQNSAAAASVCQIKLQSCARERPICVLFAWGKLAQDRCGESLPETCCYCARVLLISPTSEEAKAEVEGAEGAINLIGLSARVQHCQRCSEQCAAAAPEVIQRARAQRFACVT